MRETSGPDGLSVRDFPEPQGLRLDTPIWVGRRSQWFEATQLRLGRSVALKYLRPHLAENADFRKVFIEAGRQGATIVHPAALPIINVYPGQNCIAMQYCVAKSLQELGPDVEPASLAHVGETVMDCLSSLHATDRCHGNLSPGNLFMDPAGGVWVNDFFQPPVFREGKLAFVASRECIAPEVLAGGAPDWRADVYSLGRVLSSALEPGRGSDELGMLLDAMVSEDPDHRGGTPQAVHSALTRIKRLEEVRRGRGGEDQRARRMYRRVPAAFEVSMRRRSATPGETAGILMKTRDIGESGVFVETDDDLIRVGSILELDFTLKGVEGNVHAFGIVRWRSSPPMAKGVGVQFVEVDQAGLARLREFLGKR